MKLLVRGIIGGLAAIVVLLAGCEKEEKADADLVKLDIVEEVHQADETVVDEFWSQPIDSELCQTIGECRDLGDDYGSEHFTSFLSGLNESNNMSFLYVAAEEDESVLAFAIGDKSDEKSIIARYQIKEDEFVLTNGEEASIFKGIADIVLTLFDRNKVDIQILEFQENVYPYVDIYEGKLVMPSNLISHWLQSYTVSILVHEFGHMLTWNKEDFVNSYTCSEDQFHLKQYYECYDADSYMNLYYQAFLKDYEEQWLHADYKTVEERIAFYEKNKDSFITTYATVDPYEDIAESFTFFMLTPYNDSPQTVAQEKVNFFYQFPELVEYRAFVLKELKDRKDEIWSFY